MTAKGELIVEAMEELKSRRDSGKPLAHSVIQVAEEFGIPVASLRQRAEASWGEPLETDHLRNASYFDRLKTKGEIERAAHRIVRKIWSANQPYLREFAWARLDWQHEFERVEKTVELNATDLEIARVAFFEEAHKFQDAKSPSE
mgnify:CR=1 FL=1